MIVGVAGIGWVTSANMGCARDCDHFAFSEGTLPDIEPGRPFDGPYQGFRRMDEYSKVGLTAVAFALKDAGLDRWTEKREIGLIVSTDLGCLGVDLDYYETVLREEGLGASPALFAYTLPNSFLGEAAICFGLTGKSFVVNEPRPLGLTGLGLALDSLALGECDRILCGVNNVRHPSPFNRCAKTPPGALFFVIEKSLPGRTSHYGELNSKNSEAIEFKGNRLRDLGGLVRHCLGR